MGEKLLFNKSIPQEYLDWFNYCDDAELNDEEEMETKSMLSDILSKNVKEFQCKFVPQHPPKYNVGDILKLGNGRLQVIYYVEEFMYICYECIV